MTQANLYAAWTGILLGVVFGATQGLFFHREEWMGGYGSWRRRMTRLGHISFFGIALLNLGFHFTAAGMAPRGGLILASRLMIVAAVSMPLLCYLSAFRRPFRHLFFIPTLSVAGAVLLLLWRLLAP